MLDLVVRVPQLPRVGESLFGREFGMFVGGKGGNQALAAHRAGAERVSIIGRVGEDEFGDRIIANLSESGVDCSLVARDRDAGTGVAVPLVFDDGGNSIVSVPRANLAMTAGDVEQARAVIAGASMLLVQFEVAMAATTAAVRVARDAGVPVMINAAPVAEVPPGLLAMADYLVVNEVEAAAIAPAAGDDPLARVRDLLALGSMVAIVTLGELGLVAGSKDGVERIAAFDVQAVDSVGAGDAFCGALAVALCEGRGLTDGLRFASAAGAVSVTRRGAAASLPSREDILRLMGRAE